MWITSCTDSGGTENNKLTNCNIPTGKQTVNYFLCLVLLYCVSDNHPNASDDR